MKEREKKGPQEMEMKQQLDQNMVQGGGDVVGGVGKECNVRVCV